MIEENDEKTPVRLVGTGIRTRDLPNASLVRYHGATSLGTRWYALYLMNNIFTLTGQWHKAQYKEPGLPMYETQIYHIVRCCPLLLNKENFHC